MPTTSHRWTIAEAKARLSEVIERAHSEGPRILTKNGRSTAVVISIEEREKKTARKGSLAEFLLASPLRDVDLDIERSQDDARALDF